MFWLKNNNFQLHTLSSRGLSTDIYGYHTSKRSANCVNHGNYCKCCENLFLFSALKMVRPEVFLLVDLWEKNSDLGSGDEKKL